MDAQIDRKYLHHIYETDDNFYPNKILFVHLTQLTKDKKEKFEGYLQ